MKTATTPIDPGSIKFGEELAQRFFIKRGNHFEVHLDLVTLAALLALAYDSGLKQR